jgi:hypothetical protein
LLRPNIPNQKNVQETSPNNQLSRRTNKERPNERIPDIFGRLWATPDLLAVPYRYFVDNDEIEHAFYCIGRGSYTIHDSRDDLTPIDEIPGTSLEVYSPFTSPNSGDEPQMRIGAAINTLIKAVRPLSSVNGQTLIAPNLPDGGNYAGPFILGDPDTVEIWCNFVAEQGMYQIASATGVQTARTADVQVEVTHVDGAGNPLDAPVTHNITLTGSASDRRRVGVTLRFAVAGRVSIRARRTTNTSIAANINVSDEVQWREAMAVSDVAAEDFGDITTVQTLTLPTPQALALKERKLNMLVTRNIPVGTLNDDEDAVTFGAAGPTVSAADIIVAMALDPYIGNRVESELDIVDIYKTIKRVTEYFETSLCAQFCYTFDDSKISFEEAIADVASAVFCTAYRRGSVISISFEKETANSTLLFNHRNKLPRSEKRTVSFGNLNNFDGIEFQYTEPNAPNFPNQDTAVTIYIPADQSAVNPKRVNSVGIRNNVQAYLLANRLYNKLKYQNTVVQFEATQEAALSIQNDRILVADNTRPDTQDGDVLEQNALELVLSQPVAFEAGDYTIFLQLYDGTVQAIGVSAGSASNRVLLDEAPTLPLVLEDDRFAKTTFVIVKNDSESIRPSAFLLAEKTPQDGMTYEVKATNYDNRFYDNDKDYADGIVLFNGFEGEVGPAIDPGARYEPRLFNDYGSQPSTGLSPTTGTVSGMYVEGEIGPDGPEDPTDLQGDCIWNGFAYVRINTDVTLHVIATVEGGGTMFATIIINGVVVLSTTIPVALDDYTVTVPANTPLNTCSVEVHVNGGPSGGLVDVVVDDIYIQ